ncbi:MAG: LysM peptidoglycan-binding domain-containing protein, partial [Candidatus Omnitrophota bacterium]
VSLQPAPGVGGGRLSDEDRKAFERIQKEIRNRNSKDLFTAIDPDTTNNILNDLRALLSSIEKDKKLHQEYGENIETLINAVENGKASQENLRNIIAETIPALKKVVEASGLLKEVERIRQEIRNRNPDQAPAKTEPAKALAKAQDPKKSTVASGKSESPRQDNNIYVVKKGDTLSGIAQKELRNVSLWPKLYELNRKVIGDNAGLIFPGQELSLSISGQLPQSAQEKQTSVQVKQAPAQEPKYTPAKEQTSIKAQPKEARAKEPQANETKPAVKTTEKKSTLTPEEELIQARRDINLRFQKLDNSLRPNGKASYEGDFGEYKRKLDEGNRWKEAQKKVNFKDAFFIVGSIEKGKVHDPVKVFEKYREDFLENFVYKPSSQIKIYIVPYQKYGPIDYSKVHEWDEITNPLSAEKAEKERRDFVVWVKGIDKKTGKPFEGILHSGLKAQEEYHRMIESGFKDREITANITRVLNIEDIKRQREEIKKSFPKVSLKDNQHFFVAVWVERDIWGNITNVKRFIESGEIDTMVQKKPFSHVIFYLKDKSGKIELKYWPYKISQVLKIFSTKTAQEKAREQDPERGEAELDRYSEKNSEHLQRGEIIFGNNFNKSDYLKVSLQEYLLEREKRSLKKHLEYLNKKMVLEAVLAPVNIILGWNNIWLPMGSISRLIFELTQRPDKILPPAPTPQEKISFFARFFLLEDLENDLKKSTGKTSLTQKESDNLNKILIERWNNLTDVQRKAYEKKAETRFSGLTTAEDARKIDYYLKQRKNEATALYLLNIVSLLADIGGAALSQDKVWAYDDKTYLLYEASREKALVEILRQKYVSFTGELNIPEVVSLLVSGKGLNFVPFRDLVNGLADNYSLLDKFFSIAGVTLDLKSVANYLHQTLTPSDEAWDQLLKNVPNKPRINLYLFGFPISLIWERELVERLNKIHAGEGEYKDAFALEVKHGWLKSEAIAYNDLEFRMQSKLAGVKRIPIGDITVAGKEMKVPVYLFVETEPSGKINYRVFILTSKGVERFKNEVRKDMINYERYAKSMQEGGYVEHISPNAGTYYQRLWTRLFESHSQQGQIYFPSAYTWDMALVVHRALLSSDKELARELLDFYRDDYRAAIKSGKKFNGIPKSFNAYTAEPASGEDIAATASIGNEIIFYQYLYPGDNRYREMLEPIAEWLLAMQEQYGGGGLRQIPQTDVQKKYPELKRKFTEPNAVVYAFFNNYGLKYKEPRFNQAADEILTWAKGLWDKEKGLLLYGEGKKEPSLDAQTRWLLVLGPQKFMQEFNLSPTAFWAYLERIEKTFKTRIPYYAKLSGEVVKDLELLDLANEATAKEIREKGENNEIVRMGFPEPTAEMVGVYREARKYFLNSGNPALAQKAEERMKHYSGELNRMKASDHSLPQANLRGEYTGFGWYTPQGDKSIASIAQFDISVIAGDNMWTLEQENDNLSKKLTPTNRPKKALTEAEIRHSHIIVGMKERETLKEETLSKLVERKNLREALSLSGKLSPRQEKRLKELEKVPGEIQYFDKFNSQEFVYIDAEGMRRHIVLMPSMEEVNDHRQRTDANTKDAEFRAGIMAGKSNGAVVFERVARDEDKNIVRGVPVVDKSGRKIWGYDKFKEVMGMIRDLPQVEQNRILLQNFAGFLLKADVDGDGKVDEVIVTLIFPLDKEIRESWSNRVSGKEDTYIFRNARLDYIVSDNAVVQIFYDANRVEASTRTYANPLKDRIKLLEAYRDEASLEAFLKNRIAFEETLTYKFRFVDPYKAELDPYEPILEKIRVNYSTGELSLDTYGLFQQPIMRLSDFYITQTWYNNYGIFESSKVWFNDSDQLDPVNRIIQPLKGPQKFEFKFADEKKIKGLKGLEGYGYRTLASGEDLMEGKEGLVISDNANFGRVLAESWWYKGLTRHAETVYNQYKDNFYGAQVAEKSLTLPIDPRDQHKNNEALKDTKEVLKNIDEFIQRINGLSNDELRFHIPVWAITESYDPRTKESVKREDGVLGEMIIRYNHLGKALEKTEKYFITKYILDAYGLPIKTQRFDNDGTLNNPKQADERFISRPEKGFDIKTGKIRVTEYDVKRDLATDVVVDLANFNIQNEYIESEKIGNVIYRTRHVPEYMYSPDHYFGRVPKKIVSTNADTNVFLKEVTIPSRTEKLPFIVVPAQGGYDHSTGILVGREVDYTGKGTIKVWYPQWKNHKAVYSQDGSGSWSTINDIDRWETRIKSLKSKDGKPVIDSDS